jgi:hypothetical protein
MIDDNRFHEVAQIGGGIGVEYYSCITHNDGWIKQRVNILVTVLGPATMDDISTALNDHFPKP